MFRGPVIIKGDGALGAIAASDDNIHGLIGGGVATAGYVLGTTAALIQASDADDLGLTASYDSANKILVRYHIDEFFRLNPGGLLCLMLVPQVTTQAQMWDYTNLTNSVQKLISDADKKVKSIASIRNPVAAYAPTITTGIDADVITAVSKAQQLTQSWTAQNVFIDMAIIEGRNLGLTASAWLNLRTLVSPNVQVAVCQDKDIALLDVEYTNHAAVGTVLGGTGVRRVEEDLGSINAQNNPIQGAASFPINSAADGLWLKPALSSGKLMKDATAAEVTALKSKAFIFADVYPEFAGVYFSGSHACTDLSSDFAYGVNTRVWNKAARRAVAKLTPKINSTVDLVGGKIKATTIFGWESDINNSTNGLGSLVTAGHCTAASTYIDPDQDVFGTSKVVVKMNIVPYGYAREIEGQLSFSR